MKYTRDILVDLANELVLKRYSKDTKVDAVFLVGSVRPDNAIIESPTDVDLLVLHNGDIPRERELVKISPDYHFDIYFEETNYYNNPKDLRTDGWRGWAMWDPLLLHQNNHFFEYTQSVLRSQFDDPKNIIGRVRYFSNRARKKWAAFDSAPQKTNPTDYLKAVYDAGNAFACLSTQPFTKRGFLEQFYQQATEMDLPDLIPLLIDCISESKQPDMIRDSLTEWDHCFTLATQSFANYTVHPYRINYYRSAITRQLQGDLPIAALWPYMLTWSYISQESSEHRTIHRAWDQVSKMAGYTQDEMVTRIHKLDAFLESIEDIIDQVCSDYGVE